jgi:hypothetical protein
MARLQVAKKKSAVSSQNGEEKITGDEVRKSSLAIRCRSV